MPSDPAALAKMSKLELLHHVQQLEAELQRATLAAEERRRELEAAALALAGAGAMKARPEPVNTDHGFNAGVLCCAGMVGPDSSLYQKFLALKR